MVSDLIITIAHQAANETMYNSHLSLRGSVIAAIKYLQENNFNVVKGLSKKELDAAKNEAMEYILDTTLPAKLNTTEMRKALKNQRSRY